MIIPYGQNYNYEDIFQILPKIKYVQMFSYSLYIHQYKNVYNYYYNSLNYYKSFCIIIKYFMFIYTHPL